MKRNKKQHHATRKDELMTITEVAEFLSVTRTTVYRLLKDGPPPRSTAVDLRRVKVVGVGSRRRWSRASLLEECGLND